MFTIHDLATEMQSFVKVSPATLEKAKNSKITNKNNTDFAILLIDWQNGRYDEDPEYVIYEIEDILK
jgi:hypothetical protein